MYSYEEWFWRFCPVRSYYLLCNNLVNSNPDFSIQFHRFSIFVSNPFGCLGLFNYQQIVWGPPMRCLTTKTLFGCHYGYVVSYHLGSKDWGTDITVRRQNVLKRVREAHRYRNLGCSLYMNGGQYPIKNKILSLDDQKGVVLLANPNDEFPLNR